MLQLITNNMNFYEFYILLEGQQENQAFAILGNNKNLLEEIKNLGFESKYLPLLAYFHVKENINLNQLKLDFQQYKQLVDEKKIPLLSVNRNGIFLNNNPINYIHFTEKVHAIYGEKNLVKKRGKNDDVPENVTPIFSIPNNIDVYKANSPQECILHGKGYSFCISQPGNTMWQSYRDTQDSTFYFVFDRTRDKSDPLHIVVVDMTNRGPLLTDANNRTGNIAEFGEDAQSYLEYLKKRNVPISIFINEPKTQQEIEENEKLGEENSDLNWFKQLTSEEKSKYIGRGHSLSNEQFDFIWDNHLDSLIKQYINTGLLHNSYQSIKICSNLQYKKSYIRTLENVNINHVLKLGCMINDIDLINYSIQKNANDFNSAMSYAAAYGHKDIVELLIDYGANDFNSAMSYAAQNGHKDIVELLIKSGANNFNDAMSCAAIYGHKDVVELMIKYGANDDFNDAMNYAAKYGHKDVVELLKTYIRK